MTLTMTAPGMRVDPGAMSSPPDPEVPEKAKRRRFSAEYKLAILREVDACTEPGQIGALLRRERLYSSHLVDWRRQRDTGALEALARKRGPKPADPAGSRSSGCGGPTSAWPSAWRRRRRSSRSREKSPSCWGSRSTRPATTSRARARDRRGGGRARPWPHSGVPGAGDLPGDAVPAPTATGPASVTLAATAAAAGPVGPRTPSRAGGA